MKLLNNINDFSKRSEIQVNAMLRKVGLNRKCENQGDGRLFYYPDCSLKTRMILKYKVGVIILVSREGDRGIYFKMF